MFVDVEGLLFYGTDVPALWQRTGNYVDRILRRTKPGEQPARIEPIVNLRKARMPGTALPPGVLARAEEAIG